MPGFFSWWIVQHLPERVIWYVNYVTHFREDGGGDKTVFRGRGDLGQLYVTVNYYLKNFFNSQHKIQINLLYAIVKFNAGWCVKYNTIKIVWNSGSYFIVNLFLFNKKYFWNIGSFLVKILMLQFWNSFYFLKKLVTLYYKYKLLNSWRSICHQISS